MAPAPVQDTALTAPSDVTEPEMHPVRGLALTRDEIVARLPELLEDARKAMDDDRAKGLLSIAASSGDDELVALVRDAMVSDDLVYDFAHRDDVFQALLLPHADGVAADAAIRRLRAEIADGEDSAAFIGGYARIVGASRTPQGDAFIEELLRSAQPRLRAVGALGLLATGATSAPARAAAVCDLGAGQWRTYLTWAGDAGRPALRTAVQANGLQPQSREAIASVLGHEADSDDLAALEQLYLAGHERAALHGYMSMESHDVDTSALDRARERVLTAVEDSDLDTGARRSALYVLEYSPAFQTERAESVLTNLLARTQDDYWSSCIRDALKSVTKHRRREAARSGD